MKIGIIGATGKAGQEIVKEAQSRGHEVTAIVRDAQKVTDSSVAVIEKDVFHLQAEDIKGFDVIVNAFGAPAGQEHLHVEAGKKLIDILKEVPDTRLIVVGGAGSLFVDEALTTRLVDTPEFPKEYVATASQQGENLKDLQQTEGLKWTFLSPATFFDPAGKRTGSYVKGKDQLILNSKGDSYVSYADYAIALVDEMEQAAHVGERFTVVSEAE
ncbi:NAD(P)-dependent oxidoreductase [Bacillus pumilus]|uniref:NAD(P)-dependent oxidoreductase n=1 Tax=Bacillus pumilus TaxID=1408 RepID=UPI003917620B